MRGIKIFILTIGVLSTTCAAACSCLPHGQFDGSDYLSYTDVFKGKVNKLIFKGDIWDPYETRYFSLYEFAVEKTYKGVQSDTVLVKLSLPTGGNCTKQMEVGESWYIFATSNDSTYYVGGCSWSHQTNYQPELMKQAINYVSELSFLSNKKVKLPFLDRDCNCKRFYSGTLMNGQADGKWTTHDSLGGIIEKGSYSDGKEIGLWVFYFLDSNNLALSEMSGKAYYQEGNRAVVSYGWDGKISYTYMHDEIELPADVFTKKELEAINKN